MVYICQRGSVHRRKDDEEMFDPKALNNPEDLQDILSLLVRQHNLTAVLDELSQVCFIERERLDEAGDRERAEEWSEAGRQISYIKIPAQPLAA